MPAILEVRFPLRPVIRTGIDYYWKVIRDKGRGRTITLHEIWGETQDRTHYALQDYLRRLIKAGYVERLGAQCRPGDKCHYRLLKRPKQAPALRRDGSETNRNPKTQQIWNSMRGPLGWRGFSPRELALWASTDECIVALSSVKSYIKQLKRAGYLLTVDPGRPGVEARYRLKSSMNSGPIPPKILRTKLVYDLNLEQIMGDDIELREVDA